MDAGECVCLNVLQLGIESLCFMACLSECEALKAFLKGLYRASGRTQFVYKILFCLLTRCLNIGLLEPFLDTLCLLVTFTAVRVPEQPTRARMICKS